MSGDDFSYRTFQQVVPASGEVEIPLGGTYVGCLESTQEDFQIRLDDGPLNHFSRGLQVQTAGGRIFRTVTVKNLSASAALTVTIAIGSGDIRDSRLSFVGGETVPVLETRPGTAFYGYQGLAAVAATYNYVQLLNPAASGVSVEIDRIWCGCQTQALDFWLRRYDTALANTDGYEWPKEEGGATAAAELRYEKSASSWGSVRGSIVSRAAMATEIWIPVEPLILGEGEGLVLRGSVVNLETWGGFEWREIG